MNKEHTMNKKLLLIPMTLISCLLSGCDTSRHIELKEYFEIKQDYSHVMIDEEDQYDYGHAIGDILAKYASYASKQTFYSKGSAQPWMTYSFAGYQDGFTSFKVYFYKEGKINTYCLKDSMLSRTEQETTYTIARDAIDDLQKEVNARMEEVRTIFKEEEAKAKASATPEKFFELLENPEENQNPWVDAYLDDNYQSKRITNITPELVQDLKNLDYKEVEGMGVPEEFPHFQIRANDNSMLTIYKNVPYASSYYTYDNTLTWTTLSVVYSINEEMRNALVNRCQEMIDNHAYIKA